MDGSGKAQGMLIREGLGKVQGRLGVMLETSGLVIHQLWHTLRFSHLRYHYRLT